MADVRRVRIGQVRLVGGRPDQRAKMLAAIEASVREAVSRHVGTDTSSITSAIAAALSRPSRGIGKVRE